MFGLRLNPQALLLWNLQIAEMPRMLLEPLMEAKSMEGVPVLKCLLVGQDGVIVVHHQEAEIEIMVVTKAAGGDQDHILLDVPEASLQGGGGAGAEAEQAV